ncbi:hypothetical protein EES39_40775 [Streptomyces sp. ADI92-24]|nr:hypothetical protein EES39_40775 [Streptomyces sp. ADI92-24]
MNRIGALPIGIHLCGGDAAGGLVGRGGFVLRRIGHRDRRGGFGGDGGVCGGGGVLQRVGRGFLAAVLVVGVGGGGEIAGALGVLFVQAGHIALDGCGGEAGRTVVIVALCRDQVLRQRGGGAACSGNGLGFGDEGEDIGRGVAGVGRGGALLVARLRGVPEFRLREDLAHGVEGPLDPGGAPSVPYSGARLLALPAGGVRLERGEAFGPGLRGGGGGQPRFEARGRFQLAAVTVVGGLFAGHSREGLLVGDSDAFVVLDGCAVDAPEVAVFLQCPLVGGRTGADLHAAVALAITVGQVLGGGELVVLGLGPAHAVQVAVVRLLGRGSTGVVRLQDLGDDVGVEPVQIRFVVRGGCVGRRPLHGVTASRVGRGGRHVAGLAVGR